MKRALILVALLAAPGAYANDPQSLASYQFDPKKPLESRVEVMPDWLLRWWQRFDEAPQYRSYAPSEAEKAEFTRTLAELPPTLRAALERGLIAFYFVTDLKGNGLTMRVRDANGKGHAYIAINPAGFKKSLSQTISERERSAFIGAPELSIDVGEGGSGVAYTLTHESAHAFDYIEGLSPVSFRNEGSRAPRGTEAFASVWDEYDVPRPTADFPLREELKFYGFSEPRLQASAAGELCAQWARSPFISIYSTRHWAEEAAELLVFRHLTERLGRPYRVHCAGQTYEPMKDPKKASRAEPVLAPIYQ